MRIVIIGSLVLSMIERQAMAGSKLAFFELATSVLNRAKVF